MVKKLQLRSSQWIVDEDNNTIIGKGKMEMLESIEKTGSINQAAKQMGISYKTIWSRIKATEKHLNASIVHADRKLGTQLTAEGRELVRKYKQLKAACVSADDQIFQDIFN